MLKYEDVLKQIGEEVGKKVWEWEQDGLKSPWTYVSSWEIVLALSIAYNKDKNDVNKDFEKAAGAGYKKFAVEKE